MAKRAKSISITHTPTAPTMSIRNAPQRPETTDFRFPKYASKYRRVSNANEFIFSAFRTEESKNTNDMITLTPFSQLHTLNLFILSTSKLQTYILLSVLKTH